MKNRIIILLCLFLALSSFTGLYGQKSGKKIKISGFVLDATATPVADAVIMIDGQKTDYITDSKGYYKIKVNQEKKKIGVFISTNGIIEEDINGRENINFTFKSAIPYKKTEKVEEPVDIGYGKVKSKELTGQTGQIDARKSKYAGYNNIYELIRGQVPGVVVNGTTILIRSTTSINESNEPMFVVDGAPVTSVDNILPQDVKSIRILKGPDASIYGTRGNNGVILINLLKGNDR